MNSGIYQIRNTLNNDKYIGSAEDFNRRFSIHKSLLLKNKHHCIYLQNAWNKYKEENFSFEIISRCPKEKIYLLKLEQWFFDNWKPEYNILKVAGSRLGSKLSEEGKEKIRKVKKGIKYPNRKKPKEFTEEHKSKISKALKNKIFLEETRKKISEAKKGKKISESTREKFKKRAYKSVIQYTLEGEFIKEFPSIESALIENNFNLKNYDLGKCCKGKIKTFKGFKWKYKE